MSDMQRIHEEIELRVFLGILPGQRWPSVRTQPRGRTMIRELTSHRVNGLNEALTVRAIDEPGFGGASHLYDISYCKTDSDPKLNVTVVIPFQKGAMQAIGVNGVSAESLLAIVEDRLIGFQSGEFACEENKQALLALQVCQMWLGKRTRDRLARGVEGYLQK